MFRVEDLIKVDNEYFFAAKEVNAICKFNETDRNIEIIYTDHSADVLAFRRYARVFRYEDLLIFVPMWASAFLIYHINDQTFETIDVKMIDGYNFDYFFSGQVIGDKLILAGCQYPAIAVIELTDLKVEYYEEPFKEMLNLHKQVDDCFFRHDMASVGEKVYFASCISNKVLEFNVIDGSYCWHTVGKESNRYSGIAWDGEKMWMSPRCESDIACWDPISEEVVELENPIESYLRENECKCSFLGAVYDGENVILPGMQADRTVIINPKTCAMNIIESSYDFYFHSEGMNYALNTNGILEIYNPGEYEEPIRNIETKNDKILLVKLIHDAGQIIHEGKDIHLEDFIDGVRL